MRPAWLTDFLNRVGGPRAISLTAWLTLGPIAVLGPVSSFPRETLSESWQLLLAISLASYLPSGALFLFAYSTYLKPTRTDTRPVAALATFFLGGASTGFLLSWLSDLFDAEPDPDYLGRFLTRGLIGLCWSSIIALVLDARFRYVEAANQLRESIAENQALIEKRASVVTRVRVEILQLVQKTLAQVMENPTAKQLNQLADEVIRPLSKAIRSRSFMIEASGGKVTQKTGLKPLIKSSLVAPSKSWVIPTVVAFIAFLSSVRVIGDFTIINGALFIASWLWAIWLVGRLRKKLVVVVAMAWFSGLATHLGTAALMQQVLGGPQLILLSTNLGVWLLAMFLNIQSSLEVARQDSLEELELELQKTEWQRKKLQQEVWVETRTLARYVHGDVQGQIRAAALRSNPLSDLELEELRQACLKALEQRPGSNDLTTFFEQSHNLWAGVLDIRNQLSPEVLAAIGSDPFAQEAVIEVIRECLINAVRHGGASWVEIAGAIEDQPGSRSLALTIKNAGSRLHPDSVPGFGTELMDDATASWSREDWEHGVVVRAVVPIAEVANLSSITPRE